jgi:hypothetical protein
LDINDLGLSGVTLAKLLTAELKDPYRSPACVVDITQVGLRGVVDQVRTKLVELVAQIRSDTGSVQDPPRDAVQNAVNVIIH